jgi:hypothetical protein
MTTSMTPIQIHLNLKGFKDQNSLIYESSLVAALRNSRLITGRNLDTGIPDSPLIGSLGNWNGAMGYITILDQIGKCYRPSQKEAITTKTSSIEKSLHYFTTLTPAEIKAIYALRNAFFHDYSLLNKDNTTNYHRFKVDNHSTNPIVVLPDQVWDGDINNRNSHNETYINLKTLGDLVEAIYEDLLKLERDNNLSLDLPNGENELMARYVFCHY